MGSPSLMHIVLSVVLLIVYVMVIGIPITRIVRRAGFNPAWAVLAFVPIVNLVALWIFAFKPWPAFERV